MEALMGAGGASLEVPSKQPYLWTEGFHGRYDDNFDAGGKGHD
jgi:hypothetical protein